MYIFFLVAVALCAIASAEEPCGANLMWSYADGTITIRGRGEMLNYAEGHEAPWHDICRWNVYSVVIEEGVKTIGSRAFYECEYLKSVTMPHSLKTIGSEAFSACHSLSEVIIPEGVTSIRDKAFSSSGLTSLTIAPTVVSIGNKAFFECGGLTTITIPRSVQTIGASAFADCYGMKSFIVEEGNEKFRSVDGVLFTYHMSVLVQYPLGKPDSFYIISNRVKTIGSNAFCDSQNLNSVTIPEGVITIGDGAFKQCYNLVAVDIPNTVTTIGKEAFYNTRMKVMNFGSNLTTIKDSAFAYSYSLERVVFGNKLATIGKEAFFYCWKLTSVSLPKSLTSIGAKAFAGCSELTSITVDEGNTNITFKDGVLFGNGKTRLIYYHPKNVATSYSIPDEVTTIGSGAFYSVSQLTSITFGKNVETIEESAFEGSSVKTVIMPANVPDNVKTIGNSAFMNSDLSSIPFTKVETIGDNAFSGCSKLSSVTIPESVKTIGQSAFAGCRNEAFTTINIPASVTWMGENAFSNSAVTQVFIGLTSVAKEAFASCSRLNKVAFGENVKTIEDGAFSGDDSLTTITIPASVSSIGYGVFAGCSKLASIKVSSNNEHFSETDGVLFNKKQTTLMAYPLGKKDLTSYNVPKSVQTIGKHAFAGNSVLVQVSLNNVETIEDEAFSGCSLTTVSWGSHLRTIGARAFANCGSLNTVTIPKSVETIGDWAFRMCYVKQLTFASDSNLKTIGDSAFDSHDISELIIPDTVTSIGNGAFGCEFYDNGIQTLKLGSSLKTIGSSAFYNCKMAKVAIPSKVEAIAPDSFGNCNSIQSFSVESGSGKYWSDSNGVLYSDDKTVLVKYPKARTQESFTVPNYVTTIADKAFEGCGSLKTVSIGDNVVTIGNEAFKDCEELTTVTFGTKLQRIGNFAFQNCWKLASVSLPGTMRSIGDNAFERCYGLKTLNMAEGIESIGYQAFLFCSQLTSIEFPVSLRVLEREAFRGCGFNNELVVGEGVTSVGHGAFTECVYLKKVTIPDSVKTIGSEAFKRCSVLSQVIFGKGVMSIGDYVFHESDAIKSIEVDEGNAYYSSEDGVLFDHDKTLLLKYPAMKDATSYTVPGSVLRIADFAFTKSKKLTRVDLGENLRTIGYYAFMECSSLSKVDFHEKLEAIGDGAFYTCPHLTKVVIPDRVFTVGHNAFSYCEDLEEVIIGEGVLFMGSRVFSESSKMKTVLYQGSAVIDAFNLFYEVWQDDHYDVSVTVCVPPYYNSPKFGNADASKCGRYADLFDQCHKAVPDGNGYKSQWKTNATDWEHKINGCVEYRCHDTLGYLWWNLCNSTETDPQICHKNMCVDPREVNTSTTYLDVEFEDGVGVNEMDEEYILDLFAEYGAETDDMGFGYEGAATGNTGRMLLYASNEAIAKGAGDAALMMKNGDEGVFSKVKRIRIVSWQNIDSGARLSVKTALVLFVAMLVLLL